MGIKSYARNFRYNQVWIQVICSDKIIEKYMSPWPVDFKPVRHALNMDGVILTHFLEVCRNLILKTLPVDCNRLRVHHRVNILIKRVLLWKTHNKPQHYSDASKRLMKIFELSFIAMHMQHVYNVSGLSNSIVKYQESILSEICTETHTQSIAAPKDKFACTRLTLVFIFMLLAWVAFLANIAYEGPPVV